MVAGEIGYLFHMDPLTHLASPLEHQVIRAAAAQYVFAELAAANRRRR